LPAQPAGRATGTTPITTNDDLASIWRSTKIGLQWLLRRTGPLAVGINQGGLSTRAVPESRGPTSSSISPRCRLIWPAPSRIHFQDSR